MPLPTMPPMKSALLIGLWAGLVGSAWADESDSKAAQDAAEQLTDAPRALVAMPQQSGFSGSIILGGTYNRLKSNMVAGNDFGDVGNDRISSIFGSPSARSDVTPAINIDLRYTFASTGTQLFLGNRLEDLLRYDLSFQLGVRQQLGNPGILSVSVLLPSIPTEVWEDPYVEGQRRQETDRRSTGVRLNWENVFQQPLRIEYSYRDIELDDERSGEQFLGLSGAEARRLDREGDQHELEGFYTFSLAGSHILTPSLRYRFLDLDGKAMKNDELSFQLTYTFNSKWFSLVSNAYVGQADYDKTNPIYGKTREDDNYGFTVTGFLHNPLGWQGWSVVLSGALAKSDSNISFYDQQGILATAGVFFKF